MLELQRERARRVKRLIGQGLSDEEARARAAGQTDGTFRPAFVHGRHRAVFEARAPAPRTISAQAGAE